MCDARLVRARDQCTVSACLDERQSTGLLSQPLPSRTQ